MSLKQVKKYKRDMYQVKHVNGDSNKISRLQDVATDRRMLDYKYHWQVSLYGKVNHMKCKVYEQSYGHALEQYALDFEKIQHFRDKSKQTQNFKAVFTFRIKKINRLLH